MIASTNVLGMDVILLEIPGAVALRHHDGCPYTLGVQWKLDIRVPFQNVETVGLKVSLCQVTWRFNNRAVEIRLRSFHNGRQKASVHFTLSHPIDTLHRLKSITATVERNRGRRTHIPSLMTHDMCQIWVLVLPYSRKGRCLIPGMRGTSETDWNFNVGAVHAFQAWIVVDPLIHARRNSPMWLGWGA